MVGVVLAGEPRCTRWIEKEKTIKVASLFRPMEFEFMFIMFMAQENKRSEMISTGGALLVRNH